RLPPGRSGGFSLAELAIVLLVVSVLLGGLLMPLSAQIESRNIEETRHRLDEIREALLGYAAANGRLPCPATAASNGAEDPAGGGDCAVAYAGFVPGKTLGIVTLDAGGYALDAWGNRIGYAVARQGSPNAYTTQGGMRTLGMASLAPDLRVCADATLLFPAGAPNKCAQDEGTQATKVLTNDAVAVLVSFGRNGATSPSDPDEVANANDDRVFVFHPRAADEASRGRFDDEITWLSRFTLFSRMISAGQLP
ncbi:MAG: prepilin-type cleavage/methylation domain-containing protein, partial [Rhodocyclales bacterium CG_4_10_14_3_um_filter_68_10]